MSTASTQTPGPQLATFADLLAIPEDERFHEVLDGEIVQKARPGAKHSLGQSGLTAWLGGRFSRRPNGAQRPGGWWILTEIEVEISPHQVARPDVAGWRRDRMPEVPDAYPLSLRPDWVCEIFRDSDGRRRDGIQKRRIYADHGVPYYWLVDVNRQRLTVLKLEARGYVELLEAGRGEQVQAEPFEALELPVGVLFGDDAE